MRHFIFYFLLIATSHSLFAQASIFELDSNQSMSITGKGIGQDAAINPFGDTNSIAVIKNLGESPFNIRIQKKGTIIEIVTIRSHETKEIYLLQGYELYLDTKKKGKADVTFKKASKSN